MEQIREVKTVKVDFLCPKCEVGYLRPTGICHPMNPPMYPHKCNTCEYHQSFSDKTYPYIDHVSVDINMSTLTPNQVETIMKWMNNWDQLKDTAIPIRFKEDFLDRFMLEWLNKPT